MWIDLVQLAQNSKRCAFTVTASLIAHAHLNVCLFVCVYMPGTEQTRCDMIPSFSRCEIRNGVLFIGPISPNYLCFVCNNNFLLPERLRPTVLGHSRRSKRKRREIHVTVLTRTRANFFFYSTFDMRTLRFYFLPLLFIFFHFLFFAR